MPRVLPYADMDKIMSLSKRRGFVFQSSEIYGGLASTWDYGPLGVELKRHVKEAWWQSVIVGRDDMVGLDAAILMAPQVWVASGHVENFSDPLVECRQCHLRFRADQLETENCPECAGEFTEPRRFNLMFRTFMGPVEDTGHEVFLRPETAQGIFVNFQNVLNSSRKKLPFGIGQIGKAFRNEITPGNFTFRTREFEQMEVEFFVKPGTDEEWLQKWVDERFNWYVKHGIRKENLRLRQHDRDELAHYAKDTYDIEYRFPWGWGELEGIANRTDFDLERHALTSGEDLTYFDEETKGRYLPYVIEPSGGVDRATLAFWLDSYDEEPDGNTVRVVSHFAPQAGAHHGGGAALEPQRPPGAHRPQRPRPSAPPLQHPVRRRAKRGPAVPAAGRNRHAVLRYRRFRYYRRPTSNRSGPGHHAPGKGSHRQSGQHSPGQGGTRLVVPYTSRKGRPFRNVEGLSGE